MRDLKEDLEICEKATEGPWDYITSIDYHEGKEEPFGESVSIYSVPLEAKKEHGDDILSDIIFQHADYITFGELKGKVDFDPPKTADMEFIAAAREGWPAAINRAITAEAALQAKTEECERLRGQIKAMRNCDNCMYCVDGLLCNAICNCDNKFKHWELKGAE